MRAFRDRRYEYKRLNKSWGKKRQQAEAATSNPNPNPNPIPGTVGDNAPPEVRNPRMWAQSKRQSREIMHESAKSRGLPPPKLKK